MLHLIPDQTIIWEWLAFAIRWTHVITAIAWIGSSFYFIALDLGLQRRRTCRKGRMARNGKSTEAASITSTNTWSPPNRCPSI